MDDPPAWPLLERETLLETRVFRVARDRVRAPDDGSVVDVHRLEAPDWVNVVPVTEDGRIVLVRQWRHAARRVTLEIPGGMVDPGESPAEAARRELLEETGYGEGSLSWLGVVDPNPALFTNRCHTFAAQGVRRVGAAGGDGHEDTRVVLLAPEEVERAVADGRIDHALVVAGLFWFDRARRGLGPPREGG